MKKYDYIQLRPADKGGFILSYDERKKNPNAKKGDVYSNTITESRKEVFTDGQKAVTRMLELVNASGGSMPNLAEPVDKAPE